MTIGAPIAAEIPIFIYGLSVYTFPPWEGEALVFGLRKTRGFGGF
jgi:hypothetical protein